MVYGIISSNSIPSIGYAIRAAQSGRMSLPVAPSSYIYSHFRHVSGVPAPEGTQGVAISKLKILDVLIEQLNQIKHRDAPLPALDGNMKDEQIDALIEQYETQIRQAKAANAVMPYKPNPSAPAGVLLNLSA
ncbi:hypothetical protein LJC14_02115 [Treponema sp. OttesenSCG-928-L16]|nr:hypothetical protein [Treponema sp. OttesenSCG-928-L16]